MITAMRFLIPLLALMGWTAAGAGLTGGAGTTATLVLSADAARPGDTLTAGIQLKMPEGWHTYWVNPGDAGGATEVKWDLPAGIKAGALQWPVPEKYEVAGLTTYVYHDTVTLLAPIEIAPTATPGQVELKAKVSWLECKELCLPGESNVSARLEIGHESRPSAAASKFSEWRGKLPLEREPAGLEAKWEAPPAGEDRSLIIAWRPESAATAPDFLPLTATGYEVGAAVERLAADPGQVRIRKPVRRLQGEWPREIGGLLVDAAQPSTRAHAVTLRFEAADGTTPSVRPGQGLAGAPGRSPDQSSLALMLWFALLGGLILNVMPCVLPVIALKVLGFLKQAEQSPSEVRRQGLVYGLGVLVSFLVLALIVIGLQQGGRAASWGMQFQNPMFLVAMTTLVTLVALNLFGVFEVNLGGRTMGAAALLASKEGTGGAFFNGVLATTLATPCTAPFLGLALGFAFAQPPLVVLLMLLTVGVGLAAPYVLISFVPGLARFLPKPGPWMQRFKVAMGFPMAATGFWLLSLLSRHYDNAGVLWVGVFLVFVALAAWVWGEFAQRGSGRRVLPMIVSLALLGTGYALALEGQLDWRSATSAPNQGVRAIATSSAISWKAWNAEAVAEAQQNRQPVLVDFTADWCWTCRVNKETSIEIPEVARKLEQMNALTLLGDYTLKDDTITAELRRWGRAGVPLVLVYPRDPSLPPRVLPELLTPGIVLEALEWADQQSASSEPLP